MLFTKAMLRSKWGKYCDTDKLVKNVMELLTKYDHRNSEHGVCTLLDTYFTNKEPLIKLFARSPNYKGDMRIIIEEPFVRDCVGEDIRKFVNNMSAQKKVQDCILKYKDTDGKTLQDYIKTGVTHMNIKHIADMDNVLRVEKVKQFSMSGATKESEIKANEFQKWMNYFAFVDKSAIPSDVELNELTLHGGMKTSRAFNKVCSYYGVDKWNQYNKEFAKYSDMVSGKDRMLHFIISLNPLDYLTMSFGKSWASCHTIDRQNRRRAASGYHGGYCNGTLSYMLDSSSIITFALDKMSNKLYDQGKLYRNMFHLNINTCKFIQGRIYPQGNDGSTDLYKKFRLIVQREFSPLLNVDNRWKAVSVIGPDTYSLGHHYRDYHNYSDCRMFYPIEMGSDGAVEIGHVGICPYCGKEFSTSGSLSHTVCNLPNVNYYSSSY